MNANNSIDVQRRVPLPLVLAGLGVVLVGVTAAAPFIGPSAISLERVLDSSIPPEENVDRVILMTIRLPRVLFAAVAGGVLALAGAVFQALLRNDLATPYTLGISGGAAFGALLAMSVATWAVAVGALIGAWAAIAVILWFAWRIGGTDRVATLLLAGVTLNLLFGAGIQILQYRANPFEVYGMVRWMMGGLDVTRLAIPGGLSVVLLVGFGILLAQAPFLNVMTFGDQAATNLGFDAGRARLICLATSAAITALVVGFSGPIGFVGLIVPHAVRSLTGPDHRSVLPCVVLAGASFLVICDTAARVIGGEINLPVGIVTAVVGGPVFLWILMKRQSVR